MKKTRQNSIGGIIFGGDAQGLDIARALYDIDIPSIILSWEIGICQFSKKVKKIIKVPAPYKELEFEKAFEKIVNINKLYGWIAYPTDDDSVKFVSKKALKYGIKNWGLSAQQHDEIVDKNNITSFAKELGIITPKTILCKDFEKNVKIEFPAIIKPRIKEPFVRITKKKAIKVYDEIELKSCINNLDKRIPKKNLIIQQYIPGDGNNQLSYAGLFRNGNPLVDITVCRKRQHPPDFGRASTYVHTIKDNDISKQGKRILKKLKYTGVAEVEFKRDYKNEKLYLLEINPRTWGWHSIIRKSSGNWIGLLHKIMLNEDILLPNINKDTKWVKLTTDLPTALLEIKNGRLKIREYIKQLNDKNMVTNSWDIYDPIPFFMEWLLIPYLAIIRGF